MGLVSSVRPRAQVQRKGLFFCSVPDDGVVKIKPNNGQTPTAVFPNCIVLAPEIHAELVRHSITFWHPMKDRFPLKGIPWIVNACADADEYRSGLEMLAQATLGNQIPVFNRAEAVLGTARDKIIETVSGIDHLIVPKCIKFEPKLPKDFKEAFARGGFDYPVLVRPAASQTGRGLIKVDGPEEWDKIFTIDWAGRSLYMTQFVDRRDEDGRFTKFRVAFINKQPFLRSAYTRDEPIVHGVPRTPKSIRQEIASIETLGKNETLKAIIAQLGNRIRLNFWGVDLGYSADGDFVFFEASAAMSITSRSNTPDEHLLLFAPILTPIYQALALAISNPRSWNCWPEANIPKAANRKSG
jgi:hypothetical protein